MHTRGTNGTDAMMEEQREDQDVDLVQLIQILLTHCRLIEEISHFV